MPHLTERIEAGVISLEKIPTARLIEMSKQAQGRDKDTLGCEIMYR